MKLTAKFSLLIIMPSIGFIYGALFHHVITPLFGTDSLVHCIVLGTMFGFINYFIVIAVYKKYNLLKEDLKIDKLTGLLNRRAFDNDIKEISGGDIYSMIFMDIDNFKKFNNEFGHQTGDNILKKVSQTIKVSIRGEVRVYRYGGEEIVILLKECDKKNALKIAEKVRLNISKLDNSPYPPITVSLGISSYPEDGSDVMEIIEACDKALLTAKNLGKNCSFTCMK